MSNIIELPKNTREKLVFKLNDFRGRHYLDMRFYLVEEDGGQLVATKKGLTLAVNLYPKFKEAMDQVEEAMIEANRLDREVVQEAGEGG